VPDLAPKIQIVKQTATRCSLHFDLNVGSNPACLILAEHVVACFDLNVGSNPACFILAEHFVA
jgi:hypothetical protein